MIKRSPQEGTPCKSEGGVREHMSRQPGLEDPRRKWMRRSFCTKTGRTPCKTEGGRVGAVKAKRPPREHTPVSGGGRENCKKRRKCRGPKMNEGGRPQGQAKS